MKIWRFGQILDDWKIFYNEKMLSFNWLDPNINYLEVSNFNQLDGWTCIMPWVNEVTKGDLIFIINKHEYVGVAVVEDSYRFRKYDIEIKNYKLPGLPVKFLHSLQNPIKHNIKIEAQRPKTFYRINGIGFSLYTTLGFIKNNYPSAYKNIHNYILENAEAETNKISRICWNVHDWKKPSGPLGKNLSEKSYEGENGFGYEEWLNVKNRIIEDYHYSFLQTLGSSNHFDKIYNIKLIVNDREGKRYWVGFIKNAICITNEESRDIFQLYLKNGWLNEMSMEIDSIGGNSNIFKNQLPENLFNIKFKPENLTFFDDFYEISSDNIPTYRYKL